MVQLLTLAALVTGAAAGATELNADNFDAEVFSGKSAFIKFQAPWWGHCKRMKPAWDQLGDEFSGSATVIIGDVDCTVEKKLCSTYDVKGFPTIKYFADGDTDGTSYEGGRDFDALKEFASTSLGPSCSSDNKDLCSAEQLAEIVEIEALGKDEVESRIAAGTAAVAAAEETFEAALKELQANYERISKEKDDAVATAKAPLGMLKKVKFA